MEMHPDWVLKHKTKGTNISCINGKYYLYQVCSVWNKEKGRAQKITQKYLGRITEDGLIQPKCKSTKPVSPVSIKEYGASSALCEIGQDILAKLKQAFPDQAETLFTLAVLRVIDPNPFKRANLSYQHSFMSEVFKGLKLSGKDLSVFLKNFGQNRSEIVEFMRGFIGENEHILFDGTSILSKSSSMGINRVGYNAHREYDPQINLLYAFSCDSVSPVYYRIVPGNIRDVSAFKLSLAETKLKNLIVVADKGFGSQANFDLLEESSIKYIVPLRRNSSMFDISKLRTGNKSEFDGYFLFNKRPIWYYMTKDIIVYIDNDLKNEEEKDYILRIEKNLEGFTKDGFIERQYKFGAIVIKTNLDKSPQDIYSIYKQRREIEQSFDFLKNLLDQDKSYMQNEKSLESWAFINHLALLLNYKLFNLLRVHKLLSNFSISDFLFHLKYIYKMKADSQWLTSEMTAKTTKLLSDLNLHIT